MLNPTTIQILETFLFLFAIYQLASLAGVFSEKSGIANVAIEGNMILGAMVFSSFWGILSDMNISPQLAMLISIVITTFLTAFYMLLLGYVTSKYMADQVIVGTGMNMLAPALALFMYILFIGNKSSIDPTFTFWKVWVLEGTAHINKLSLYLAITALAIAIISYIAINKTRFGLRLRSSGENPYALETSGVSVFSTRMTALFIAGMLSTMAGIAFAMKGTYYFTVNGSGFLAIGIMILAQWKVQWTTIWSIVLALLIATFNNFANLAPDYANMQFLANAIPFVIPLIGMIIFKSHSGPKANGTNFKKDQR